MNTYIHVLSRIIDLKKTQKKQQHIHTDTHIQRMIVRVVGE